MFTLNGIAFSSRRTCRHQYYLIQAVMPLGP